MNKITISVSELKSALPGFSKVIIKRTALPVLGCVLFQTNKQEQLQLTATNLDDHVSRTIETEGEIQAAVPFASLRKIVNGCAITSDLRIEALKEEVRITYPLAGTELTERIHCLPVEEFPAIPEPEWHEPVTVGQEFKEALREALDSASTDESRHVLQSAFVDVSDPDAHYIVGTSGRELFSANSFLLGFKESLIIPSRSFLLWKGFMEDGDWNISLSVPVPPKKNQPAQPNWIKVQSKQWQLITRQIDGNYPNWRQVIPHPSSAKAIVTFPPEASQFVISAAPRLPGANEQSQPVVIETQGKSVLLAGRDKDNEATVPVVAAKAEGQSTSIGLNRNYLLKALKLGLDTAEIHTEADPNTIPVMVFKKDGKRLVIAGLRPDTSPAPNQQPETPAPDSSSSSERQDQPAEEQKEEMKTANRIENVSTETANNGGSAPASAVEQVRIQLENVKEKLRGVVTDINDSLKLLAQAQKERRASEKEIEDVRETLQSLQKIRI